MSFDGFWEIGEQRAEERRQALEKSFWVIRDGSGTDVVPPKTFSTEQDAWKAVVKAPFDIGDYQRKGYTAAHIDAAARIM